LQVAIKNKRLNNMPFFVAATRMNSFGESGHLNRKTVFECERSHDGSIRRSIFGGWHREPCAKYPLRSLVHSQGFRKQQKQRGDVSNR